MTLTHAVLVTTNSYVAGNVRHTLDGDPRCKFQGANLDLFEANGILELDLVLDPSLHLGSPNHELSFELFVFWSIPIDFPSKMVPCRFRLDLPLFGLEPSSKGHGFNLLLSSNRIPLFHLTSNLKQSSKVAVSLVLIEH